MRQIIDLNLSGKWIELWFLGGKYGGEDSESFDDSYKFGELENAVKKAGLQDHVLRNGYIGLWLDDNHGVIKGVYLNLADKRKSSSLLDLNHENP